MHYGKMILSLYFGEDSSYSISPSGRYIIIGDVWLSDRSQLLNLIKGDRQIRSDLESISILWEYSGIETFDQLIGMFDLAIWDREQKEVYLGRDFYSTQI